jgi:hypothetical protein
MNFQIKTPFTPEQVETLNKYQNEGRFHPFTCKNDGDEKHILYEFHKEFPNVNYYEYIEKQKSLGIPYPEAQFSQTNLIATEGGWICPVCDYTQNWAHNFMTEKQS